METSITDLINEISNLKKVVSKLHEPKLPVRCVVVRNDRVGPFEYEMNKYIDEGYVPSGNMVIETVSSGDTYYLQVMLKYS